MRLTISHLRRIIKEEVERSLNEGVSQQTFEDFLRKSSTWFVLEEQNLVAGQIQCLLSTRRNGSIRNSSPGKADILEAQRLKKEIMSSYPGAQVEIDFVDEFVNIEVTLPLGV